MNRCLVVALIVMLVSSGVQEFHDAVEFLVEETGVRSFIESVQDGSITQISMWDHFTWRWWWGSEEVGVIRRRKKPISSRAVMKPKAKE